MADTVLASRPAPEQAIDDAIDAEHDDVKNSVHQRLRANSSIMQMRKILGMYLLVSAYHLDVLTLYDASCQPW